MLYIFLYTLSLFIVIFLNFKMQSCLYSWCYFTTLNCALTFSINCMNLSDKSSIVIAVDPFFRAVYELCVALRALVAHCCYCCCCCSCCFCCCCCECKQFSHFRVCVFIFIWFVARFSVFFVCPSSCFVNRIRCRRRRCRCRCRCRFR